MKSAARATAAINAYAAIVYGLKVWADFRKHDQHDSPHSQRCGCFSMCVPCITETITVRGKRSLLDES